MSRKNKASISPRMKSFPMPVLEDILVAQNGDGEIYEKKMFHA